MSVQLRTPFHPRTAEHNRANAWVRRGLFTVPAYYEDPCEEALAARMSAVMVDASCQEQVRFFGEGAADFLSSAFGDDIDSLLIGRSVEVFWCGPAGGLRGLGVLLRLGDCDFLLRAADADFGWFAAAAPRFGAVAREETRSRGVLAIGGPFAGSVLDGAGLSEAARLETHTHAIYDWGDFAIIAFHGAGGWYEISCAPEDAVSTFDRILDAGRAFGLRLAGQDPLELLLLEAGRVNPYCDFVFARASDARDPRPAALGLPPRGSHIPTVPHAQLAGIALDTNAPRPFADVLDHDGKAGHTLSSRYSPALQRAIALASLSPALAVGSKVRVLADAAGVTGEVAGEVVALPFL